MQRQRCITAIKSAIEKKKKNQKLSFHSVNKINKYNRGGEESKRNYRARQNVRIINVFLESLLSMSFPSLVDTVSFTSLRCPPTLHWSNTAWTCCGSSSGSNLVTLLCVLASNVHIYQNQCIFFCWSSQCAFISFIDTESAQLIMGI